MTDLARFRVELTWTNGGPGVTTFNMSQGTLIGGWDTDRVSVVAEDIAAVLIAYQPFLSTHVGWKVGEVVDIFDDATGELVNQITHQGTDTDGQGTAATLHQSRGTQICVGLLTDRFGGGRRLQGRHFIGPVGDRVVGSDGLLETLAYQAAPGSYAPIITGTGARLAVYHRPKVKGQATGYYGDVTSVRTFIKPANLRSRRD